MRKLSFLPLVAFIIFAFAGTSIADVFINDARVDRNSNGGFTSSVIESGSGDANDYELIVCGILTDGADPFNPPSPGVWTEFENAPCESIADCQLGFWGRFTNNQNSEEITCSWGNSSNVFLAGSYRFLNVDQENPIIDVNCSSVENGILTLPSVTSEPGAQLVTVSLGIVEANIDSGVVEFDSTNGLIFAGLPIAGELSMVLTYTSELDADGSGFNGGSVNIGDDSSIKQCALTLRMGTRNVPTMSEWGLISFAAFAGIAGIWYLRRRQAAA
ncbi:MAG: IPTL-CTERM sorting domain-containing protein [Thermodesulfobacteriota bacterium]